jgi:hypothetical protein
MSASSPPKLRFEPIDVARFALGEGPFRARGAAYEGSLAYADKKLPGGRAAIATLLGAADPYLPYFDRIFVVSGAYDASPLVRLNVALAERARVAPAAFVEAIARKGAERAVHGIYKPMLKTSSPEAMATRLFLAFNRYYEPTEARTIRVEPGRFEGELVRVPSQMNGLYVASTTGFVSTALELAGAAEARVDWPETAPDGELQGVRIERARFVATWR